MTPKPITISPDLPIAEALELMRQKKVHRFPVLNKVVHPPFRERR